MKMLMTMTVLSLVSCRTAFISDYTYPGNRPDRDCYYTVLLEEPSFLELSPIAATTSESVMVDGQWTTVENDQIVGYGLERNEYSSFLYLMEKAMNQSNGMNTCGKIFVNRIQHQYKQDYAPFYSALMLFIPNVVGFPIKSSKVQNTYLFEVFNAEDQLIYRGAHSGAGKAVCGFYYGFKNPDEKADYDATYAAIEDFRVHFRA